QASRATGHLRLRFRAAARPGPLRRLRPLPRRRRAGARGRPALRCRRPGPGPPVGVRGALSGNPTPAPRPRLPADAWVLVVAAFAVAIGHALVAPVLPQYAQSFDVSVTAASVVVSAFAFFRLVFAPAGGVLVDRMGERWVYMTGLLIVVVSTLATGL